jgi:hypothetical protein
LALVALSVVEQRIDAGQSPSGVIAQKHSETG